MSTELEHAHEIAVVHHIESASAGTACQTSSSKFAYVLTAGILALIAAFIVSVTLLAFSVVDEMATNPDVYRYDYEYGNAQELEDSLEDYLRELERQENTGWSTALPQELAQA